MSTTNPRGSYHGLRMKCPSQVHVLRVGLQLILQNFKKLDSAGGSGSLGCALPRTLPEPLPLSQLL